MGDYKLIKGFPGLYDGWYKPGDYVKNVPEYPHDSLLDYSHRDMFNKTSLQGWINFVGLFNLKDDPNERNNLYKQHPNLVKKMRSRMQYYIDTMVPADFPRQKTAADPKHFGGAWSPGWC